MKMKAADANILAVEAADKLTVVVLDWVDMARRGEMLGPNDIAAAVLMAEEYRACRIAVASEAYENEG